MYEMDNITARDVSSVVVTTTVQITGKTRERVTREFIGVHT